MVLGRPLSLELLIGESLVAGSNDPNRTVTDFSVTDRPGEPVSAPQMSILQEGKWVALWCF